MDPNTKAYANTDADVDTDAGSSTIALREHCSGNLKMAINDSNYYKVETLLTNVKRFISKRDFYNI